MNQWLLIRRLRWPAFLMLIGIMALLNEWDVIHFHRSWPLLLILAGVLSLAERAALTRVDPVNLDSAAASYPPYAAGSYQAPPATTVPAYQAPGTSLAPTARASEEGKP